jgi:hypothetical protein
MASNIYRQSFADGTSGLMKRSVKQGRISSGLGKPKLVRLYKEDEVVMDLGKQKLGCFYNENEFIRNAVKYYINNVYTELLNT